ncbi:MAG TPA: ATP-binding protein [Symbiobacteriaceae bacterium]
MFSSFRFIDFKSFEGATLKTPNFTLIIGANASGKSNAVDGMRILRRMADPVDIGTVLDGVRGQEPGIRGGSQAIPRIGAQGKRFHLSCHLDDDEGLLAYRVVIDLEPRVIVSKEWLDEWDTRKRDWIPLFDTGDATPDRGDIQGTFYSGNPGRRPSVQFLRNFSALSQVPGRIPGDTTGPKRVRAAAARMANALRKILVLDPVPQLMRNYQPRHRTEIIATGENLSAVVANLIQTPDMKEKLLTYLQDVPEQQITDLSILEAPTGEVMLQVMEQCGSSQVAVDARSISDGTLRYLAVLAALLSEKPGTTLVVEEIDNGLHPSRVGRLLAALREAGIQRGIQVIATTHNPALLNALTKDDLKGVTVCYRDAETGTSRFVPWLEIPSYPALMARARLGDLVARGDVLAAVHADPDKETKDALDWIKENLP